ncbi:mrp-5 [Bugula neritina]|uniref:Mrp-5 n=1 Tax=Bugula neritina TaxID=10212 RepID=A0A7J7KPQ8_BUGNE|nr:mrp-5 [Bugula neritina]
MVSGRLICAAIINIVLNTAPLLRSAYFLRKLLELMETPGSSYLSQVWYILAITFCTVIRTTTLAGSFNLGAVTGIRVRCGVLSLVFKKKISRRTKIQVLKPFARKIGEIRKKETNLLEKSLRIQSILSAQSTLIPVISAVVTFFAMTMTDQNISVTQAFVYVSLLTTLRLPLGNTPYLLKSLAEGLHVCQRIKVGPFDC